MCGNLVTWSFNAVVTGYLTLGVMKTCIYTECIFLLAYPVSTRSWSSQNHRVGLHSARPPRKASGTSGRTRSSAGPGAVPSATDGKVGLSTWQGFHLCGAWASGLQATACALTHIELWRHRDVNPCAVSGQTRGVTPHNVESPSMVDPQYDLWYWGSKWNLLTVCWSAVGCEWGTTSVYFGITYVCSVPSRLHVFAVEPQYLLQDFLFLSKVSFEGHIQNLQKISCWFKIWMRFVGPILIKLWTSCIWGFS